MANCQNCNTELTEKNFTYSHFYCDECYYETGEARRDSEEKANQQLLEERLQPPLPTEDEFENNLSEEAQRVRKAFKLWLQQQHNINSEELSEEGWDFYMDQFFEQLQEEE